MGKRGHGDGSIRQRIRPDGSTFWEARIMVNGRQQSFYDHTRSGAMAAARQARADAERGVVQARESLTVATYLRSWLENTAQHSVRARTYNSYRQLAEVHVIPAIGSIRLVSLTPGNVQSMLADAMSDGKSLGTARKIRAMLSSALRTAQLDYGLPRNVASLAKIPKSDRPSFKAEVVTPEDARRLLDAFTGSRLQPLVLFSVATGLRQGELLALRWQDIDFQRGCFTITHAVDIQNGKRVLARPKTQKAQRALALTALAKSALRVRRDQEADDRLLAGAAWQDLDLVFPGPNGNIRDGCALTRNFKAHLERRGIEPIRWHALRRVFAALLQDQGVALTHIRDLMGHSELRVTEAYAYTTPESLAQSMRVIDDALSEAVSASPRYDQHDSAAAD